MYVYICIYTHIYNTLHIDPISQLSRRHGDRVWPMCPLPRREKLQAAAPTPPPGGGGELAVAYAFLEWIKKAEQLGLIFSVKGARKALHE